MKLSTSAVFLFFALYSGFIFSDTKGTTTLAGKVISFTNTTILVETMDGIEELNRPSQVMLEGNLVSASHLTIGSFTSVVVSEDDNVLFIIKSERSNESNIR